MATKALATPLQEESNVYLNEYESISFLKQNHSINPDEQAKSVIELSNHWSRYFITELYGTWIATFIVDFALYTLSGESYSDILESGYLYLSIGIAFGYFFGILICWDANLNIVFTLALAICKAKPWKMVPIIIIAQIIGAVFAHFCVYFIIGSPDLDASLAFCFGIIPPPDEITNGRILFSSILCMTILILSLLPVFDPKLGGDANMSHSTASLLVFAIISGISVFAIPSAAQTNPTNFFAAYVTMWMLGFDNEYFVMHNEFWWTAFVGPLIGIIASFVILISLAVVTWNEPKEWKSAFAKMIKNE